MRRQGLVKKMDNLGRIVIPIELREMLKIDAGDKVELIISEDGTVALRKFVTDSDVQFKIDDLEKSILNNNTNFAANAEIKSHIEEIRKLL